MIGTRFTQETDTKENNMRDIEITESSSANLARAEAKRERRRQRNLRLCGDCVTAYARMTVSDLYNIAKGRGLKVTTKTRKGDLIELLSA